MHELPVLAPIDESGRMIAGYGDLTGLNTTEVEGPVTESLRARGLLVDAGRIVHRYPICWRCKTPLVFRVVDDWFISADEIRQPMLDANSTVEWTPPQYKKRMDDWLRNMGDWNISRKRYFGLPLPFYECECGELNVIGSRAELEERAVSGLDQLQELHRPWIDDVQIRCTRCERAVERIPEVGDAWLDAGIVHFATLGWQNREWVEGGNATGSAKGLTGADLPDHAYWEQWFPADWVSEMREQIRLWFYATSFMSVTLDGRSPYRQVLTYEKVYDEHGKPMHKSTGNMIELNDALERMGADAARWLYCEQAPSQPLRFGFAMADDVKRRLLTLWNSVRFFVDYATIAEFRPRWGDLPSRDALAPLDHWLIDRTHAFVEEVTDAYERFWTPAVVAAYDTYLDDLSNWYIRRSRRRFWDGDHAALHVLWLSLVQSLRVVAPVLPFLTEYLWQRLVTDVDADAPRSIHLAGWVEPPSTDAKRLTEMAEVRRVVELGRQARATSGLKLRQPLRRLVVQGAAPAAAYLDEIRDELRVKDVQFGEVDAAELTVKPNLPVLGPKLGRELAVVRAALQAGEFERLDGGHFRVAGHELGPDEVLVERRGREGWAVAGDDGVTVALDTSLDAELELEGRVLDLIHLLNTMRKDAGLELTDRIRVTLPAAQSDLLEQHRDWIASEVLAVEIEANGGSAEPQIAKA